MTRLSTRAPRSILLACVSLAVVAGQAAAQSGTVGTRLTITVPSADAALEVNGSLILGQGTRRVVHPPPLQRGTEGKVTVAVRWEPNNYTKLTRTRVVTYRAGEPLSVDLTLEDPADRVLVRYVPTPPDIAEAMVRLANVTARDVVFEPGCCDARITIAAVKAGARRAVCIDIDPERVVESRANVKQAGLSKRIDVRQGDALDIKDLSTATVVFLYMGDEFNLLMRPHLWRELPVGARVVSHRFLMGDWKPDNTVHTVSAEGGTYDLHIWTITPQVKKRAAR